ncbi:MAG: winged helix DNA-binding protein [Sphingobium sp.]
MDKALESGGRDPLDRRWHLARNRHEVNVTELEFSMMRVGEAFSRWESECLAAASGLGATGSENALLHVIRLHDRPKPLKELARLTNRDDIPNLQYALRKLAKLGLIRQEGGKSNAVYSVTDWGREVTERYARLREELLIEFTQVIKGIDERLQQATRTLNLLSGIYEQAARVVATHQKASHDREE